jgi:hypothetical protein
MAIVHRQLRFIDPKIDTGQTEGHRVTEGYSLENNFKNFYLDQDTHLRKMRPN